MPRGYPRKQVKYNTSGLWNQSVGKSQLPHQSPGTNDTKGPPRLGKRTPPSESGSNSDGDNSNSDLEWDPRLMDMDSVKDVRGCYEPSSDEFRENEADLEGCETLWNDRLESELLCEMMLEMAAYGGDDPNDEDWLPARLRQERQKKESKKKCTHSFFHMQYDHNKYSARP
jgi:hypothetical protein